MSEPTTALTRVTQLAAKLPQTPVELVERIRQLRTEAHVLSPAVTAASIPEHIKINTVVEVIDTSFDAKTGRGKDVYYQASIHKSQKKGDSFEPLEVSLNAQAIKRLLTAMGVSVTHSEELPTGNANHWKWQSRGKVRDFDGSWRDLPPGTAEIDLRDGSAQIGEWTKEAWAAREAESEKKAATLAEKDRWKAKPKPIGGWSGDRVMNARRFGLRLAEAKSLNALGRNIGLQQIYSIDELKKPFVIFRATFDPDMSDPTIKQMVTAAELGAINQLYPALSAAPATPALPPAETSTAAPTAAADVEEVPFEDDPEPTKEPANPGVLITAVSQKGADYFVIIDGDRKLHTTDRGIAKACNDARKAGTRLPLVVDQHGDILEIESAGDKL